MNRAAGLLLCLPLLMAMAVPADAWPGRHNDNWDCFDQVQRGADWHGKNMEGQVLKHIDLRNANLSGVNLHNARLECVNLDGADLRNADLRGAELTGVSFEDANLRGAQFDGSRSTGVSFAGTALDGVSDAGVRSMLDDCTGCNLAH